MDKINKFYRRLSARERAFIKSIVRKVINGNLAGLDLIKLEGSNVFYRVRKRKYRIIFYYDATGKVVVHDVDFRKEATYKNI